MAEEQVAGAGAGAEGAAAAGAEGAAAAGAEGAEGAAAKPSFADFVPTEFKDSPWVKENMATPESFFKFVDNQNTLVGKKGLEAPGSPDEYEFPVLEEFKDHKRDEEFQKGVKQTFKDAGVPKDMAAKIYQGVEKMLLEKTKGTLETQKAEDAAFEKFNSEFFGDKKEEVVTNAQKILREMGLPAPALATMDKMTADQLALVIAVTDGIYAKFGKEDGFRGGDPGAQGAAETYETLSAQQRELMKNPGYSDWQHAEHKILMEKNSVLLAKMRAIKK